MTPLRQRMLVPLRSWPLLGFFDWRSSIWPISSRIGAIPLSPPRRQTLLAHGDTIASLANADSSLSSSVSQRGPSIRSCCQKRDVWDLLPSRQRQQRTSLTDAGRFGCTIRRIVRSYCAAGSSTLSIIITRLPLATMMVVS